MNETLESRHREGPADRRVRKKKISLAEYSKKRVSSDGRRSAGKPEGARALRIKENEILLTKETCCYKDDEARTSPTNCQEGYRLLCVVPGFNNADFFFFFFFFADLVVAGILEKRFSWRTRRPRELPIVECRQEWVLSCQYGAMGLKTWRALARSEVRRGKLPSTFGTSSSSSSSFFPLSFI